jgi:hypothetical protein
LPEARKPTYGAYVRKEGVDEWQRIQSVTRTVVTGQPVGEYPPTATNLLTFETPITDTNYYKEADLIGVFGVYDPYDQEPFSGVKMLSKVNRDGSNNIVSVEWKSASNSTIDRSSTASLDRDDAYVYLKHPEEFTLSRKIGKDAAPYTDFYEGIVPGKSFAVRGRAVDTFGKKTPWAYSSIVPDSDTRQPNPIYFQGFDGDRKLGFKFDFRKNNLGVDTSGFHTETNLSHIELVIIRGTTTNDYPRNQGTLDPGPELYENRIRIAIPLPANVNQITEGVLEYIHNMEGNPFDYYAWARLVTRTGVTSKWYKNDAGFGDGSDGVGPLRADALIGSNLIGNSNSNVNTVTIDTSTSSGGEADPPSDTTAPPPVDIPTPSDPIDLQIEE